MGKDKVNARIAVILAKQSPQAIIFRRGPSRYVQLIAWDTSNDTFLAGQWLCGRIYEKDCDLSLSGKYLIYFAEKSRGRIRWTAISRPPFLHALALWPGNAFGGGGFFDTENSVVLRLGNSESQIAPEFVLPKEFAINKGTENSRGKTLHEIKYGWNLEQGSEVKRDTSDGVYRNGFHQGSYLKTNPVSPQSLLLKMTIYDSMSRNNYNSNFEILNANQTTLYKISDSNWADWGHNGDLLFAKDGKLFRILFSQLPLTPDSKSCAVMVKDLNDSKFEEVLTPPWAKSW